MSSLGGWFTTKPCAQIAFIFGQSNTLHLYPICSHYFDGSNPLQRAIVEANFLSSDPNEIAAALGIPFGTAGWISFLLHAVAVEIYVCPLPHSPLPPSGEYLLTHMPAPPHTRRVTTPAPSLLRAPAQSRFHATRLRWSNGGAAGRRGCVCAAGCVARSRRIPANAAEGGPASVGGLGDVWLPRA